MRVVDHGSRRPSQSDSLALATKCGRLGLNAAAFGNMPLGCFLIETPIAMRAFDPVIRLRHCRRGRAQCRWVDASFFSLGYLPIITHGCTKLFTLCAPFVLLCLLQGLRLCRLRVRACGGCLPFRLRQVLSAEIRKARLLGVENLSRLPRSRLANAEMFVYTVSGEAARAIFTLDCLSNAFRAGRMLGQQLLVGHRVAWRRRNELWPGYLL